MRGWESYIRRVTPYTPGEQPAAERLIKLNTNENPYPPAPAVRQALMEMDTDRLRKYPDPASNVLVQALAKRYGVEENQVFVGVGSDDVLGMAFMTFFNSTKPVLFPDITYSFYPVWADLFRIPYETRPLDEEFRIRTEDYFTENGGIVIPNPNAPTGLLMPLDAVERIAAANPDSVVIIDEAYIDFGGTSAVPLIDKYDNLLVVQTFSKSRSLAGMRIGFALGQPELIRAMSDVKYSYNSYTMNLTAQIAGAKAVEEEAYFQETVEKIIRTREEAKLRLAELGFTFPDSQANFIFASHKTKPAQEIFQALKEANIFVRYFPQERIDNYLRITVGTDEEMEQLFSFLKQYLASE
ncbi:MAG: histidinol-phosphate transaminase [Lachnospiraceae bacterium]|jgi:histidinol-phosphate aminotransferase